MPQSISCIDDWQELLPSKTRYGNGVCIASMYLLSAQQKEGWRRCRIKAARFFLLLFRACHLGVPVVYVVQSTPIFSFCIKTTKTVVGGGNFESRHQR